MKKPISHLFSVLILVLAVVLAACAPAAAPLPTDEAFEGVEPVVTKPAPTPEPVDEPPAMDAVKESLAGSLGVAPGEIQVLSVDAVDFGDGCLDLRLADEECTAEVVPGYRGTVNAGGMIYTFHSDESGSVVRFLPRAVMAAWSALAKALDLIEVSITLVSYEQVTWSNGCLDAQREGEMCTEALVPGYRVSMMAEGAPYEYHTDLSGENLRMLPGVPDLSGVPEEPGNGSGPAYTWHREGGIAGFCDDVTVRLDGEVLVSNCRGSAAAAPVRVWLSAASREALAGLVNDLGPFSYETPGPVVPDMLVERIEFYGNGEGPAGEDAIRIINEMAGRQAALAGTPLDVAQEGEARANLEVYFSALNAGNYAGAAAIFGGSLEPLAAMNPDLDANDAAALFERGCTTNGFVCSLAIAAVMDVIPVEGGAFRFVVELSDAEGSPFVLGPCCGADPATTPAVTEFGYEVYPVEGAWKVWDLPVYVP